MSNKSGSSNMFSFLLPLHDGHNNLAGHNNSVVPLSQHQDNAGTKSPSSAPTTAYRRHAYCLGIKQNNSSKGPTPHTCQYGYQSRHGNSCTSCLGHMLQKHSHVVGVCHATLVGGACLPSTRDFLPQDTTLTLTDSLIDTADRGLVPPRCTTSKQLFMGKDKLVTHRKLNK